MVSLLASSLRIAYMDGSVNYPQAGEGEFFLIIFL
jgi:hypothetical protein